MTDQPNDTQEPQEVSSSPSQAQNSEHMIPKSRFDEVNTKYRDLQAQLEQLQSERQQAKEAELAEQQRWQELYEEAKSQLDQLQTVKTQAEQYQEALMATNQARISQIPEDKRHLIPEYDDPVRLGAWLDKALPDLVAQAKPSAPKLDGGSGSGNATQSAQAALPPRIESVAEIARQHGYEVNNERVAQFSRSNPKPTDTGDEQ